MLVIMSQLFIIVTKFRIGGSVAGY